MRTVALTLMHTHTSFYKFKCMRRADAMKCNDKYACQNRIAVLSKILRYKVVYLQII